MSKRVLTGIRRTTWQIGNAIVTFTLEWTYGLLPPTAKYFISLVNTCYIFRSQWSSSGTKIQYFKTQNKMYIYFQSVLTAAWYTRMGWILQKLFSLEMKKYRINGNIRTLFINILYSKWHTVCKAPGRNGVRYSLEVFALHLFPQNSDFDDSALLTCACRLIKMRLQNCCSSGNQHAHQQLNIQTS